MTAIYEPRGMAREYAALACNLYRGCTHGCRYCYAPAATRTKRSVFVAGGALRDGVLQQLQRDAPRYTEPARSTPALLCLTSDPSQPNEDGHTRQALEIMANAGTRFQVLTKGGVRALRDLDIIAATDGLFGTTLLFTDETARQDWEPGAASIASRVEALRAFHDSGIRTWVSIEPVIEPRQAVDIVHWLDPWVDEWRLGKLNHHPRAATIAWRAYAADLWAALADTTTDYMVKKALAPFWPDGAPLRRHGHE